MHKQSLSSGNENMDGHMTDGHTVSQHDTIIPHHLHVHVAV